MTYISFGKAKAPHAATLLYHRSTIPPIPTPMATKLTSVSRLSRASLPTSRSSSATAWSVSSTLFGRILTLSAFHVHEPQHARLQVHQLLREELGSGLHALSLVTKTPEEVGEEEDAVTGVAE